MAGKKWWQITGTNKWVDGACAVAMLGALGASGYCAVMTIPDAYKYIKHRRYAMKHLDEKAVVFDEANLPFMHHLKYKDVDGDGDYESFLTLQNQDGSYVDIDIEWKEKPTEESKGVHSFPNLEEMAVTPADTVRNNKAGATYAQAILIDYKDVDGDGKLESLTSFGPDKENMSTYIVLKNDGAYHFKLKNNQPVNFVERFL